MLLVAQPAMFHEIILVCFVSEVREEIESGLIGTDKSDEWSIKSKLEEGMCHAEDSKVASLMIIGESLLTSCGFGRIGGVMSEAELLVEASMRVKKPVFCGLFITQIGDKGGLGALVCADAVVTPKLESVKFEGDGVD